MILEKNKFDKLLDDFMVSKDHITLEAIEQFATSALSAASLEYNASLTGMQLMADRIKELEKENKELSNVEYNPKVKIPQFVADWLNNPDVGYSLSEKIKYLILSHDGDEYYFCDMMVNDSIMSLELGEKMYRYSQKESAENLLQLINGYEVEEETKYWVAIPMGFDPDCKNYFVGFLNGIQSALDCRKKEAFKFDDFEKAKAVAQLINGNVEEVNHGEKS